MGGIITLIVLIHFPVCPVDQVFEEILYSSCDELRESRDILKRIIKRDLYQCLGPWKDEKPAQVCVSVNCSSVYCSWILHGPQ